MKNNSLFGLIIIFSSAFINCSFENKEANTENEKIELKETMPQKDSLIFPKKYIADSFDFPVGKPEAKGYYNAQPFGENDHLGDDWNAVTGGNSDLGDPIYSIGNGYVKFAEDIGGGWGNVIRIDHQLPNGKKYESFYAHCDKILVNAGDWIDKGAQIGTIGNANGQYYAHLHFEIRDDLSLPIGGGYSSNQKGYLDPTKFIKAHRTVSD